MGATVSRTVRLLGPSLPTPSPRMSVRDTVTLSPWEKWKKHGRFPWKILVHLSLLIVVTAQLLTYNSEDSRYFRGARRNWYYFFFPADYDFSSRTHYLYTVEETVDAVQHALSNYEKITLYAIDYLNYTYEDEQNVRQCLKCGFLEAEVYSKDAMSWEEDTTADFSTTKETYWVNATHTGPLDIEKFGYDRVAQYIHLSRQLSVTFQLASYNIASLRRTCVVWSIRLLYDFQSRGQIALSMDASVLGNCDTTLSLEDVWSRLLWINFVIIFLASVHLILNVRSLLRSVHIYYRARQVHHELRTRASEDINRSVLSSRRARMMEREREAQERSSRRSQMDDPPDEEQHCRSHEVDTGEHIHGNSNFAGNRTEREHLRTVNPGTNGEEVRNRPGVVGLENSQGIGRDGNYQGQYSQRAEGSTTEGGIGITDYNEYEPQNRQFEYNNSTNEPVENTATLFMSMSWNDKLKFFNIWFVSTTVASLCLIAHGMYNLLHNTAHAPTALAHKLLAGIGCGLLWATLVAYLAHNKGYYTVVLTLNRAIPRVFRFMVGVVPILLGYAVFGMLYFGDYTDRFGNFQLSMISLFSVLNGDVIRETYMDLLPFAPVVTQIYLYTFISLFIYVVLNVFIAIVEESFFSTRSDPRSLEQYAKILEEADNGPVQYVPIPPISPPNTNITQQLTPRRDSRVSSTRRMDWFHRVLDEMDGEPSAESTEQQQQQDEEDLLLS